MTLDTGSLERAIARLTEGAARYERDVSDDQIRDGLIQRFEYTYELSHKTLKRSMESVAATPAKYDATPFPDLIRSANEQGLLLGDWTAWRGYRDMRSKTGHTDVDVVDWMTTGEPFRKIIEEGKVLLRCLREQYHPGGRPGG